MLTIRRRQERIDRRAGTDDWIGVALADLTGNRDYLDAYGVEGYMAKALRSSQDWMLVERNEAIAAATFIRLFSGSRSSHALWS